MDDPPGPAPETPVSPPRSDPLEATSSPTERLASAFADLTGRGREWVRWIGPARLAAAVGVAVVVAGLLWWLLRSPPPPIEARLTSATEGRDVTEPPSTATAAPPPAAGAPTTAARALVVHVAGGVVVPGLYELAPGARVADAIAAAGGAAAGVDPDTVNLAAPVLDGDRIVLAGPGEPGGTAGTGGITHAGVGPAAGPVNVNTATAAELDALPGVGPATAAAIVAHRLAAGPFASVDELEEVRGIGPAKLEALRGLVTV